MAYKLDGSLNVPLLLLIPTASSSYGVQTQTYPSLDKGELIFGSFRTFGGTERDINGVYTIENTATVETWYRPDIKSDCRIALADTGDVYEILGEPENINRQNQILRIRVRQVKGGA